MNRIATSLADVLTAFGIVYQSYLAASLIDPNNRSLHASREAIHESTCVALGYEGDNPVITASAIVDRGKLPLDCVYKTELDDLRIHGAKLLEIGMFASVWEDPSPVDFLIEPLRFLYHYALCTDMTHVVCGINPRRCKLYSRMFGFEKVGHATSYPSVRDNPVQMMIVPRAACQTELKGIAYFNSKPVPCIEFEKRYRISEGGYDWSFVKSGV